MVVGVEASVAERAELAETGATARKLAAEEETADRVVMRMADLGAPAAPEDRAGSLDPTEDPGLTAWPSQDP